MQYGPILFIDDKIFGVNQILIVEGAGGVVTRYRNKRVNFKTLEKFWMSVALLYLLP